MYNAVSVVVFHFIRQLTARNFLFSGRGYWQAIICGIIQGRAVGVAHYLLAAQSWALGLTPLD